MAAVSHRVILDGPEKHADKTYLLTGPQLLNMPELGSILSRVLDHRVRYLHLPSPIFKRLVMLGGVDEWMADGLVAQFKEVVRPDLEGVEVSHDTETITGKPATSFEEWASKNRERFAGFDIAPYLFAVLVGGLATAAVVVSRP